mgnify:CR=1 FL=1
MPTQSIGTIGVITTKTQTAGKKIPATEVAGTRFNATKDLRNEDISTTGKETKKSVVVPAMLYESKSGA